MRLQIQKTTELQGVITPPSSKSHSIRGLLLAVLAKGESELINVLESTDTVCAKNVCKLLGATIIEEDNKILIKSEGLPLTNVSNKINTGDSGVITRLVIPMLGLRENTIEEIILDCGEQMRKRPIKSLLKALNDLGMTVKSLNNDDCLPVSVSGKLVGGKAEVAGNTSQFISALLLFLPCAQNDSVITVKNVVERPYLEITLEWLLGQGIKFNHYQKENLDIFEIYGRQSYRSFKKQIPADFSSLSYPLAAAVLLSGKTILQGIDMKDSQGDKRLIEILQLMGADIEIKESELIVNGGKLLKGREIDANDIPDLVPTLAVIGTQAEGITKIVNVAQARLKETDRLHSMAVELQKMGANIEELSNGLIVKQSNLTGASVHGYDDHRTIMALAVAGLLASGETVVDTAEGINKTFPKFLEVMNGLGARINLIR